MQPAKEHGGRSLNEKLRLYENALSNPTSRPSLAHALVEHILGRRLLRPVILKSVNVSWRTNMENACLAGDQLRGISLISVDGAHGLTKTTSVSMGYCGHITQLQRIQSTFPANSFLDDPLVRILWLLPLDSYSS